MPGAVSSDRLYYFSSGSLIALILLCLAWELWLAPLRPGGSWLVLKVLPLLVPLFGILRRKMYTFRWSPLLILAYFVEGTVRGYAETGFSGHLARLEILLSLSFFLSTLAYVRAHRDRNAAITAGKSTESEK